MLRLENTEVLGFEAAVRGMRNPMNSWERSGSSFENGACELRGNDHALMLKLARSGPVHAKYRRMVAVYVDITAPLYWWKEFDTYKVGTVANSCSTMHKLHAKEFTLEDFSCEALVDEQECAWCGMFTELVRGLNVARERFLETGDKKYWRQMIQLLPTSYNQRRTVMLNYEVLAGIYRDRREHKLDEWRTFCRWIEGLPHSELITCK